MIHSADCSRIGYLLGSLLVYTPSPPPAPPKSDLDMFTVLPGSLLLINDLLYHRCGWRFRKMLQEWMEICKSRKTQGTQHTSFSMWGQRELHKLASLTHTHTHIHTHTHTYTHTHTHVITCTHTQHMHTHAHIQREKGRERVRYHRVCLVDLSFDWLTLQHLACKVSTQVACATVALPWTCLNQACGL